MAYFVGVHRAGGVGVLVPPIVDAIDTYLTRFDAFIITGGGDPRMEPFGVPTHPKASLMHPLRQEFDTQLIRRLLERPDVPALGICLGMQLMSLVNGGRMDQHLPDTLASHAVHWENGKHAVRTTDARGAAIAGLDATPALEHDVVSHHRQCVSDPGSLSVFARSDDGLIEGVCRHDARFFVGVQWHPERTGPGAAGQGVFDRLVGACRRSR